MGATYTIRLKCDKSGQELEVAPGTEVKAAGWKRVSITAAIPPIGMDLTMVLCPDCYKKYVLL